MLHALGQILEQVLVFSQLFQVGRGDRMQLREDRQRDLPQLGDAHVLEGGIQQGHQMLRLKDGKAGKKLCFGSLQNMSVGFPSETATRIVGF